MLARALIICLAHLVATTRTRGRVCAVSTWRGVLNLPNLVLDLIQAPTGLSCLPLAYQVNPRKNSCIQTSKVKIEGNNYSLHRGG